jgi:hypothetical protein
MMRYSHGKIHPFRVLPMQFALSTPGFVVRDLGV